MALAGPVARRLDSLTKPQGSLGRLEEIALRYCLARGTAMPEPGPKKIVCMAADHGVAEEGVSAYPQAVTAQMVANMLAGGAAINVLARHTGAELELVDMGVAADLSRMAGLRSCRIRAGSNNIARGPAMSVEEAIRAVETGISIAREAASGGFALLGTGDMGIANTTPSSALFAALLPCRPAEVTGRGTGVDEAGLQRKLATIEKALSVNRPRLGDPLSALAALGGFEIAGIAGLIIGGAAFRLPVVVDGFISSAAALCAIRMNPAVARYIFFSHVSAEAGHRFVMDRIGERPVLDLSMRLGEGTGAAIAMSVIEAALKLYREMATFESAGVSSREGA